MFGADNAHRRADVRQHQLAGHIADRPNARDVGLHLLVDLHEAALTDLDADLFESEAFGIGTESDRHQSLIRFEGRFLAIALKP